MAAQAPSALLRWRRHAQAGSAGAGVFEGAEQAGLVRLGWLDWGWFKPRRPVGIVGRRLPVDRSGPAGLFSAGGALSRGGASAFCSWRVPFGHPPTDQPRHSCFEILPPLAHDDLPRRAKRTFATSSRSGPEGGRAASVARRAGQSASAGTVLRVGEGRSDRRRAVSPLSS